MDENKRSVDIKGDVREGVIISGDGNVININSNKQKQQNFGKNHAGSAEKMNFAKKSKLAEALLACPTMSNRGSRDAVVNNLRDEIRNGIQRNDVTNIDVMNILNRCLDFSDGIKELIMIVRTFEGNSDGMQKVEEALKYAGISE